MDSYGLILAIKIGKNDLERSLDYLKQHSKLPHIIYILEMQDEYSGMFNADHSQEHTTTPMHFFAHNQPIIAEGQRHKVIFGQMQLQQRPIHQILTPYFLKFANKTMEYATKASTTTYQTLKAGMLWMYNKFRDQIIPFAAENLPKVMFVTKKKQAEIRQISNSFEVISIQEDKYDHMLRKPQNNGRARVVIPLGTNHDAEFQKYLQREKYEISYDIPIDDQSEQYSLKQSFMIPSQSYEAIAQQVEQSHAQLHLETAVAKKKAYKLQNCFIFQFQGQNTIEYDMLDSIQKCKETELGYIVFPEQVLRKSMIQRQEKLDQVGMLIHGVEQKVQNVQKVVDNEIKVRVEINNKKSEPQAQLLLN